MKKIVVFGLLLFVPVLLMGQSLPSAKATAAVADAHLLASTSGPANIGWTTILAQQIKTANQKDLFINASLECGIYSDTLVRSSGGITDASLASGGVRVRVVVDPAALDQGAGPSDAGFFAAPGGGHDVTMVDTNADGFPDDAEFNDMAAGNGVSYCKRIQYLSAKLQGILDLSNTGCFDGDPNTTCNITPEEIRLALATLDANAFNFIAANLGSGPHWIEVQAKLDTSSALYGSKLGSASAKAFVGMGSVTIEAVRMIKGETVEF